MSGFLNRHRYNTFNISRYDYWNVHATLFIYLLKCSSDECAQAIEHRGAIFHVNIRFLSASAALRAPSSSSLFREAVQHQLSRTVNSTHIQEDISRSLELAEVLSFVKIGRSSSV